MTTRSCNFFRSQSLHLLMGYNYGIQKQVHLLEKNSLGTSCQVLVTLLLHGYVFLINCNNSSHGWATVIKFRQLQKL